MPSPTQSLTPGPDPKERQALIDEFGECDRQVKLWTPPINPHEQRRAELAALILGWYANYPADQAAIEQGRLYQLEVKPKQWERDLTEEAQASAFAQFRKLKVLDKSGEMKKFNLFSVFTTTQGSIQKYLGERFLDKIAPKRRSGRRTLTVTARSAPAKVA